MDKNRMYKNPKRSFERSGQVDPAKSYHVQLENVVNTEKQDIKTMVDEGRYFSIFAPRQSGKTTFSQEFCEELEKDPTYIALFLNFQRFSKLDAKRFYQRIQQAIHVRLINRLAAVECPQLDEVKRCLDAHELYDSDTFYELLETLNKIIKFKKIVIFIDEFDGIPGDELADFLVALRELYQEYKKRTDKALYSVGLIGVRNIAKLTVGGVSPFNIADHVKLPPFNLNNIRDLYAQYTEDTNQPFTEEAVNRIHEQTSGQPWLANRLGSILTTEIKPKTTAPVTADDVDRAIDFLLKEDNNHFENLLEKALSYKHTFARVLSSEDVRYSRVERAQSWLRQHGLIKEHDNKVIISNPIYEKWFSELSLDPREVSEEHGKKIFISYSRKDKEWLDKLIPHLKALEYEGVQYWCDEKIRTGDEWSLEIQEAIETSRVALCLISKNYLGSEYIRKRETPEILNRRKEGLTIIPILAGTCAWKRVSWLKDIQMNPKDGIPLDESSPKDQDKKIVAIVDEIGRIFDV